MLWVGITGGIACGKSEIGRCLAETGVPVCDADDLARQCMAPGGRAYKAIAASLGMEIMDEAGRIDRARLARRVFADPVLRRRLESLVHPYVRAAWREWRRRLRPPPPAAALIVPLLYETEDAREWDAVVCVAAPLARRREWLRERGLAEADMAARFSAQIELGTKMERADFALFNSGTRSALAEQTRRTWSAITRELSKGGTA
jgi:dephospho-CoA kinase